MKIATWLLRVAVAIVFIAAAIPKILGPPVFLAAIQTYRLLPDGVAALVALWLPWLELSAGLAVFPARQRRAALGLLLVLTTMFLAALAQAWARGLDIICGCFGSPATVTGPVYWRYLSRDVLLLVAILFLMWREPRAGRPD